MPRSLSTATAPDTSDASPEEFMAMEALVQANQAFTIQLEELKSQYARLAADFDNFRKRTQKEKLELEAQAAQVWAQLDTLVPLDEHPGRTAK